MAATGLAVVILVYIQFGTVLAQADGRNNSVLRIDGDENVITLTSIENIVKKTSLEVIDQLVGEMRKGFQSLKRKLKLERSRRQLLEDKIDKCISGVQQPEVGLSSATTSEPTSVSGGGQLVTGLSAHAISEDTIFIQWNEPASSATQPVIMYIVTIMPEVGTFVEAKTKTTVSLGLNTTIDGLTPSTNYTVFVETYSSKGLGPRSEEIRVSTSCTEGFTLFEGHCYLFELANLNLNQARRACRLQGAHLVSVNTQAEQDFLVKQIKNNYSTSQDDNFWIGMNLISGKLEWEDGTDVVFTAWGNDEPNCMSMGCGVFLAEYKGHQWEDGNSGRYKFNIICEQSPLEEKTPVQTTVSPTETTAVTKRTVSNTELKTAPALTSAESTSAPASTTIGVTQSTGVACTEGFTLFEGHCYRFELASLNLVHARVACKQRGAYLVSVNTQAEQDFLVKQINNSYSARYFWIGMKLISEKLKWDDGTDVGFTAWGDDQPNCMDRGCGVFLSWDFQWEDANSDYVLHSVCEQSPPEEETSVQTTDSPSETNGKFNAVRELNAHAISNDKIFIQWKRPYFSAAHPVTMYLVTIIPDTAGDSNETQALGSRGPKITVDGLKSATKYTVFVQASNFKESGPRSEISVSTLAESDCPEGFAQFEDHCYLFRMVKTGWKEARDACEAQGAYLVSINTQGEQDFLETQIQNSYTVSRYDTFWIGWRKKSWKMMWEDGTDVVYTYWHKWYPNCLGSGGCVAAMHKIINYRWEDTSVTFHYSYFYICELPMSKRS